MPLKVSPSLPGTKPVLFKATMSFSPTVSNVLLSPRHHATIPSGAGTQTGGPSARTERVVKASSPIGKAPGDWRTPKPGGCSTIQKVALASWSAPVLWRFCIPHASAPESNEDCDLGVFAEVPSFVLIPRFTARPRHGCYCSCCNNTFHYRQG
jgi:hypothetical protein